MKIGISLNSAYLVEDPRDGIRSILERVRAAAAADLDWLTIGDRHSLPVPYYANVPTLARALAEWPADRPAGLLFLLPLWHPVLAAEQIGTLATMTDARFIVQAAIGHGEEQFAAMGADLRKRGRDIDEALRVIKGLLAGERVDSERFGLVRAQVSPRPQEPPEWWICAGAPGPLARAAREGDVWYANADVTPTLASQALDIYREACTQEGTSPRAVVRKDVIILRDADRARRLGDDLIAGGYRGFPREAVAYGSVDEVVEQLQPYRGLGCEGVMIRCMGIPQADALETVELAGEIRAQLCGP